MDDFGEELESLYLAAPRLDISRHIGVSRPGSDEGAQEVCQKTTSFLDLPGELRNAIYSLALNRDPFRISIGFRYTTDLPRRDPDRGRPKPPYHGAYNGGLIRSATGTITRTAIKERWPALTQALPSLRREVLEVHYSENVFRMILRNFLDRRLCAQWVLERGRLLKALKEIKLQMPYLMRYAYSLVVVVAKLDDGSIAIPDAREQLHRDLEMPMRSWGMGRCATSATRTTPRLRGCTGDGRWPGDGGCYQDLRSR